MSEEDDPYITVLASIAQTTGALKTMADGGFRWIFDIPESELPAHVRMHLNLNKRLKLTVEAIEEEHGETPKRSETDRRADRELSSIRMH